MMTFSRMFRSLVTAGLFVSVALFLSACMSMGINLKNKTPHKPAKLPVFTVRDSLVGHNNPLRSCYDVRHYDIRLRIDPVRKSLAGSVTTRFELVHPSRRIQLDLDPQLQIDSVTQTGQRLSFSRQYTAVYIDLFSEEREQALTVYYQGAPAVAKRPPWEGGFVWKKDRNKKPFIGVACEGSGAHAWLPVKTYLGDEPDSISVRLSVPADLVAVSNGNLISVREQDGEKIFHWQTSYGINPYNITCYVGDYKLIEDEYICVDGGALKLSYYVLPENYHKAGPHFQQVRGILRAYESLFGVYPWVRDGFKLVESPFSGMEHQTAIAYGNGYKNERNESYDYIILHEAAHEWWGNAVSVADFSDVWIHEGLATYSEALYVEYQKDYRAYQNYMSWLLMMIGNKKPVIGPPDLYYWNYRDGDPYVKGAAMLHTLRNHLDNDTLFFGILKKFYEQKRYKITHTQEFIELVETMSGKPMEAFFRQYLYQRESPLLIWSVETDPGTQEPVLLCRFDRVVPGFTTPVEVEQLGKRFYIDPAAELRVYTLPYPASVPVKVNLRESYMESRYRRPGRIGPR